MVFILSNSPISHHPSQTVFLFLGALGIGGGLNITVSSAGLGLVCSLKRELLPGGEGTTMGGGTGTPPDLRLRRAAMKPLIGDKGEQGRRVGTRLCSSGILSLLEDVTVACVFGIVKVSTGTRDARGERP